MPDQENSRQGRVQLLRELLPTTFWGRAMAAGIAVWFVNWVFSDGGAIGGSAWIKTLIDLASVAALIPLTYYLFRASRWVVEHLLWRLRRRLIVTYLLIGALPLVLVLVLVALTGYAVLTQSSSNLVARQLDGYLEQSQSAARALVRDLGRAAEPGAAELRQRLQSRAEALSPVFPELLLGVYRDYNTPIAVVTAPRRNDPRIDFGSSQPDWPQSLAGWLRESEQFHGLVVASVPGRGREVRAVHFLRSAGADSAASAPMYFFSYPIGEDLAAHLTRTTDLEVRPGRATLPFIRTQSGDLVFDNRQFERIGRQPGIAAADVAGYPIITTITDWETGLQMESDALSVDPAFLEPGQILRRIEQFRTGSGIGAVVIVFIGGVAIIFLIIALVASVSAIVLTRSITGAVHSLYQGTLRIEAGDLEHEIPIRGRDQLSELAVSFNQMTGSVRELLRVSAEKQRLDQEMKIAAEVQARLFPREAPAATTLDLAPGICIPARSVSGDYYDFLQAAPGLLGVVVADVCGKGVSAALMMANLQANLRGQVMAYRDAYGESAELPEARVRRIVDRVNRQLAGSMMDSNYVTLFYAEFDETRCVMHYTNAGHNPPLLLRAGDAGGPVIERLDCGGTVIGLFRDAQYEEAQVEFGSGDLLVVYTDGLLEARSTDGEEFGEQRLTQLLMDASQMPAAEIETLILQAVRDWTGGAEQEDDLTLVVVRGR